MLSTWLKTLEYVRLVRGYPHVSPTSFVAAQGGHQSDMFRLKWAEENSAAISLPDFHLAFLMSPLFRIELFLLSTLQSSTWKETTRLSHLKAVAKGQQASVGPWTTIMNDGDTNATFSSTSPTGVAVTRIMQCRVQGTLRPISRLFLHLFPSHYSRQCALY